MFLKTAEYVKIYKTDPLFLIILTNTGYYFYLSIVYDLQIGLFYIPADTIRASEPQRRKLSTVAAQPQRAEPAGPGSEKGNLYNIYV